MTFAASHRASNAVTYAASHRAPGVVTFAASHREPWTPMIFAAPHRALETRDAPTKMAIFQSVRLRSGGAAGCGAARCGAGSYSKVVIGITPFYPQKAHLGTFEVSHLSANAPLYSGASAATINEILRGLSGGSETVVT